MSDDLNAKPTTVFYIVAGVFATWNLIGLMLYYQQMTVPPEAMASLGPVKAAFVAATPVWANAAYGTAVTFGLVASILLLLRNSLAVPAYVVSFVGIILQDLDTFVLRDGIAGVGDQAIIYIVPPLVFVIALVEIWYARSVANRYYR